MPVTTITTGANRIPCVSNTHQPRGGAIFRARLSGNEKLPHTENRLLPALLLNVNFFKGEGGNFLLNDYPFGISKGNLNLWGEVFIYRNMPLFVQEVSLI
jgi:hypothetical protein